MDSDEKELAGRLKDAGNRLLESPSSTEQLLKFLGELEVILSKVEQSPSKTIQEALLPPMKALISDHVLNNSDSDTKISIAVCFNEIMRITAPDSPYDDRRMKEIFELLVASFGKLSLPSGHSYSKALAIIDSMAKVRSCVMMLDLDCNNLIIEMFEQFKKHLRSEHPHNVFLAMEEIMSLIIEESEDIPLELLKVLLDCVRKEKENTSPMSWRLGAKVIERTSEKLKPYLRDAIRSGNIREDDYGHLVDSIFHGDCENMEQNHVSDSAEQVVPKEPVDDASSPGDAGKSGETAAKAAMSPDTEIVDQDSSVNQKPSKTLGHCEQSETPGNDDSKTEILKENEKSSPNKGLETPSKELIKRPRGRPKKILSATGKTPVEVAPSKENEALLVAKQENHNEASVKRNHSSKKLGRPRKDATGGSGNMGSSTKLEMSSSKKGKSRPDEIIRKRRKRDQMEEEVFETPFGKKKYKEDIIGCRLKIWWPRDKKFYEGCVASYDPRSMKHRVVYSDGDVEILNLVKETFEFVDAKDLVNDSNTGSKPHPSSERVQQDHSGSKAETPSPEDSNTI